MKLKLHLTLIFFLFHKVLFSSSPTQHNLSADNQNGNGGCDPVMLVCYGADSSDYFQGVYTYYKSINDTLTFGILFWGIGPCPAYPTQTIIYYSGMPYDSTIANNKSLIAFFPGTYYSIAYLGPVTHFFTNNVIIINTGTAIGINESKSNNACQVFPNPVQQSATVKIPDDVFKNHNHISFEITDLTGKRVAVLENVKNDFQLDRKDIQSGIYFYQLLSGIQILSGGKLIFE